MTRNPHWTRVSWKHSSGCDLVPVRGLLYHGPDCVPSATGHLELQLRACETVCRPLSLQPAHSRLSKDNWKPFFSRTHFLSFSSILIVYGVLEAFSLNATLIFTFNNNNNKSLNPVFLHMVDNMSVYHILPFTYQFYTSTTLYCSITRVCVNDLPMLS